MPLPLLFIGAAAAAGALGIGKTVKASIDQKEANETNERADDVIRDASNRIETARKKCGTNIENLGKCKIKILDTCKALTSYYIRCREPFPYFFCL